MATGRPRLPDDAGQTHARRELRRIGAAPIGDDVWAVPDAPAFVAGIERVSELVDAASGILLRVDVEPQDPRERMRAMTAFNAARSAEWTEFRAECREFDGSPEGLDLLRRRAHAIQVIDIFSVPEAEVADRDLRACVAALGGPAT
ncbi:MAG: hypothetical protein PSX37_05970 [bacterium]|nr:hypothetical protein [bacterium]